MATGKKYHREIKDLRNGETVEIDVYRFLKAFKVTDPGAQQGIKKLACAGLRDKGTHVQDYVEAADASIEAARMAQDETGEKNVRLEILDRAEEMREIIQEARKAIDKRNTGLLKRMEEVLKATEA